MTKRMLSLLLALVMTLSLCVPALAADEFEAETVTEVEEQAPEAPAEPEAPEAEVVEEPVAEEEPVEAPEVAAALVVEEEPEDGPAVIALGTIKERVQIRLENTLELAKPYKTRVDNGELYAGSTSTSDPDGAWTNLDYKVTGHDPAKAFNDAYTEAERNLKGLTGEETGADVTEKSALKAAIELGRMLPKNGTWGAFATTTGYGSKWQEYEEVFGTGSYTTDYPAASGTSTVYSFLTDAVSVGMGTKIADGTNQTTTGIGSNYAYATYSTYNGLSGTSPAEKPSAALTLGTANDSYDAIIKALDAPDWTLAYRSDYLEALKAVVTAAKAAKAKIDAGTAKYSDISAVAKLFDTAKGLEKAAAYPDTADATTLRNTINATTKIIEDPAFNVDAYVFDTAVFSSGTSKTNVVSTMKGFLNAADALLVTGVSNNEFAKDATYYAYKLALRHISVGVGEPMVEDTKTIALKSAEAGQASGTLTPGADVTKVTVQLKIDPAKDKGSYAWTYSVNGKFANMGNGTDEFDGTHTNGVKNVGTSTTSANVNTIATGDWASAKDANGMVALSSALVLVPVKQKDDNSDTVTKFTTNTDDVKLYLYKEIKGTGVYDTANPTVLTITLPKDGYVGPGIAKKADGVTYDISVLYGDESSGVSGPATTGWSTDTNVFGKQTSAVPGPEIVITVKTDDLTTGTYAPYAATAGDVVIALQKSGAKTDIVSLTNTGNAVNMPAAGTQLDLASEANEKKLDTLSGYEIQMRVKNNGEAPVAHRDSDGVAAITFDSLATWTNAATPDGMAVLSKLVKIAGELKKSDFQISSDNYNKATLDQVFDTMIPADVKAANDLIAQSTSLVNSSVNRAKVNAIVANFITAGSYITAKTPNIDALKLLIAEAELLTDDEPYTAKSWIAFQDTLVEAKDIETTPADYYQSEVDEMVTELKAAMDGLTQTGAPDKTDLKAAIKEAEALKKDDYTAETWTALETALASAKNVEANGSATQTQIDNALKALKAAKDGLKKTDAAELAEAKEALAAAEAKADALTESEYTAASWADLKTALDAAAKLGADATAAQVKAAADAIEAAIGKLEKKGTTPVQPTIPAAPASGTGWVKASDGTWYYYKDKALQKDKWIYGKGGLWYYVGPDGDMWTGFKKIGNAYFMLQTGTEGGVQGKLLSGWINDPAIPGKDAYARTDRNSGHFGEITWTAANGDFVNGHFTKGDPAA